MAKVIKYDEYLRVLDLRNNRIPLDSLKKDLFPALKSNNSITNLDLSSNPCYTK